MQNFKVIDRPDDGRFDEEFKVIPDPAEHTPSPEEQAYLDRLKGVLDVLAADAKDEEESLFSPDVLAARRQARATAVAALRANAEADQAVQAATQKIDEIDAKYQKDRPKDGSPKFEIKRDNSRFLGYFTIKPTQPLSTDEEEYLKQVWNLLKFLAGEADNDQDTLEPASPRSLGHIDARQSAAERASSDVIFIGTRLLTVQRAIETLKHVRDSYEKAIENIDRPKLEIEERADARFTGDFRINVSETPNPEDTDRDCRVYVTLVKDILHQLALDAGSDKAHYSEPIQKERQERRKKAAEDLKSDAEAVSRGRLQAIAAANAASTAKGRYLRELELVVDKLFTVTVDPKDEGAFAVAVDIKVAKDLLPPANVVSPEKQELYIAILAAQTVIKTVCGRIDSGDDETWCGQLFGKRPNANADDPAKLADNPAKLAGGRASLLRDSYMRKLAAIGELGLQGQHTALAKVALDSLRSEFVAQEGPRIKNSYVCRLGVACGAAALAFLVIYVLIRIGAGEKSFWHTHRTFFLAGTGAAIGTWLSFSIREVEVAFDHLGVVEADLLDPAFRVLFVVALTITACLLFWTGVMNVEIGNLKTSPGDFGKAGTVALLIGLFSGLSERALATSVSGRAASFVKGIGG